MKTRDSDLRDETRQEGPATTTEEPPPFGGSWGVLYVAVLLNLAVLVLLFHLFTRAFG